MEYKEVKRLSPSSINLFIKDYKKWYENYILGQKIPNNIYFEFGTAFHGLLEDFFKEDYTTFSTIKEFANQAYNKLFKKWFTDNTELHSYMTEDINLKSMEDWTFFYIAQWIKETEPLVQRYGMKGISYNIPDICEWHLEDEELKIHGYADAYRGKDKFNTGSGFLNFHNISDEINPVEFGNLITDYKTSKVTRNTNNTSYFLQCMIYALMYQRKYKSKKQNFVCVDYIKYYQKHFYHVNETICSSIEKLIKDVWLQVDMINREPEKYSKKPPQKISLKDYL